MIRYRTAHIAIGIVLAVLAAAASAGAETVVAIDGQRYIGDVRVTAHEVYCVTPAMRTRLSLGVVQSIELSANEQIELARRKRTLGALDAEAHYQLGLWLKSKHQQGDAVAYFEKAVAIDADHVNARRELGYVKRDGAWTYDPALHSRMMFDWVGAPSLAFHYELAQKLQAAGRMDLVEKELRRVVAVNPVHEQAVDMLRPIIAKHRAKNHYRLPFEGTWLVISGPTGWGHRRRADMLNAWDFRRVDANGSLWSGPQTKLENHLTWNQPVFAAADGEVYKVISRHPDNPLGQVRDLKYANRVFIRHANGERSVIGHLKQDGVTVKVGDKVKQGQLIGYLGNSGRSATPHIHFAVFDADGVSLPVTFDDFAEKRDGEFAPVAAGDLATGGIYENTFGKTEGKQRESR